jgi:hypothetical protein
MRYIYTYGNGDTRARNRWSPHSTGRVGRDGRGARPGWETAAAFPTPVRSAQALAQFIGLAPHPDSISTLDPPPPWVWWDHPYPALWPPAADRSEGEMA